MTTTRSESSVAANGLLPKMVSGSNSPRQFATKPKRFIIGPIHEERGRPRPRVCCWSARTHWWRRHGSRHADGASALLCPDLGGLHDPHALAPVSYSHFQRI